MIYALRANYQGQPNLISDSLRQGVGRFGWSYEPTADLRQLKQRIEQQGWDSLNPDEQNCYQRFLLDIASDDYVIYVNQPTYGECLVAQVTGEYFWDGTLPDFNHCFRVDPASVQSFDRNDAIVHPTLSARLKFRRRWQRIFLQDEFDDLLARLARGDEGQTRTLETRSVALREQIRTGLISMAEQIQHANPNFDLEELLEAVVRNVPGVKDVQRKRGRGDKGADLLVTVEERLPITGRVEQRTGVIQVKSFKGRHETIGAVQDIERALEAYPEADFGLIMSTASERGDEFENAANDLQERTGKRIELLTGGELALFVLKNSNGLIT